MSSNPERTLIAELAVAAQAIAVGAEEACGLLGPVPADTAALQALGLVERTAARALLKAVEQQQDVVARLFRTFLAAESIDVVGMTARDIANRMEKYGALDDADSWSELVRLRNKLVHEYPVAPAAQLDRLRQAAAAVPRLKAIVTTLAGFLSDKGYLP